MPQFVISYFGGSQPATPEEGQQHFAKYKQWLRDVGDAVVSPMNPFKNNHTISTDGTVAEGSKSAMSGYTIIQVDSIDAALSVASTCPFLDIGGTLEVAELVQMS